MKMGDGEESWKARRLGKLGSEKPEPQSPKAAATILVSGTTGGRRSEGRGREASLF
jgi:hypothetical protein